MGKKYWDFVRVPSNHRQWEDCTNHCEFKKEHFPYVHQSMRYARKGHARIWEEDYYMVGYFNRKHNRCWKKYRKTQYRIIDV